MSSPTFPLDNTSITGGLLIDDNAGNYGSADQQGFWQHFVIRNSYEKDRHIYQMGICSPSGFNNQSVAFVQLASPTLLWICNWTLARVGSSPIVPDPIPSVSDWVLLDDWWDPDPIRIEGADGVIPSYMIAGTFVYGHPNPSNNTNLHVVYPITPWLNASIFSRGVPNSLLKKGLTDGSSTSIGTGGIASAPPNPKPLSSAGGASGQGIIH